jgi:hypothetical protein
MQTQSISISERLIAGFLFALMVGLTAICVPIALVFLTRGKGLQFLGLFNGFRSWESDVLMISAIVGLALGPDRSMALLGHLWGTERPRNFRLTFGLWACLTLVAFCSYLFMGGRHGI